MTMPPDQPSSAVTSTGLLLLGGFLSGAAVATKYPEVIFCALPLAAFVGYRSLAPGRLVHVERWQSAGALAALALFLSASAVGCGPWLVKNALATGNPVYPLLYDVFGGATRTPAKEAQWSRAHRPPGYSPGDLASRAVGFAIGSDWLSPLAAPLAVLAWWSRRRRPIVQHLTAYLLYALAAWWLLTHRIERFWVPILPIVALLAGIGALWSAQRWWRATLAAFVSAGLAFSFAVVTGGQLADTRYLAPLATLRNDPDRVEPWHLYINEHAGEITGLLLVGDAQPFDLTVPVLYNTVFDDSIFEDIARGRGDAEISSELARRGISHIYVSWREIERYRSPGNYGFTSFVEPDVFRHLVSSGVLEELPQLADDSGEMFRVLPGKRAR